MTVNISGWPVENQQWENEISVTESLYMIILFPFTFEMFTIIV